MHYTRVDGYPMPCLFLSIRCVYQTVESVVEFSILLDQYKYRDDCTKLHIFLRVRRFKKVKTGREEVGFILYGN